MREQRIRKYATGFLLILVVYTLYYPYHVLSGLLDFAFFQPNRMLSHPWGNGYITDQTRWMWFFMWMIPILVGIYTCIAGLYVFYLGRIGRYFDPKFGRGLIHVGSGLIIGLTTDFAANAASPKVLSWFRPDGTLPFRYFFNSSSVGLILCGCGFVALGLVLQEANKIAEENKAFV